MAKPPNNTFDNYKPSCFLPKPNYLCVSAVNNAVSGLMDYLMQAILFYNLQHLQVVWGKVQGQKHFPNPFIINRPMLYMTVNTLGLSV